MTDITLREHFDAVIEEMRRAGRMADEEREKSAQALRDSLDRAIHDGDDRLLDHITNQIAQVKAALDAERRGQDKFEHTVEKQFAQVNEFRGALDDLGKSMATRRELETLSSSVSETLKEIQVQISELRSRLDIGPQGLATLQSRADLLAGRDQGVTTSAKIIVAAITLVGTMLAMLVVVINLVTQ